MTWAQFKANFANNPKSTIVGFCGLIISITLAWMALPKGASIPITIVAIAQAGVHVPNRAVRLEHQIESKQIVPSYLIAYRVDVSHRPLIRRAVENIMNPSAGIEDLQAKNSRIGSSRIGTLAVIFAEQHPVVGQSDV